MTQTQTLIDCLRKEAEAVTAFAQSLADEREAMKRGDFAALTALVARKTAQADSLARLGADREARMTARGLRAGPGGQLLGSDIDPAVADAWRKLRFAATAARDAIQLNGAIIKAQLEFTREALQALRSGGADAGLYGRNGRAETGLRGVSLASG